VESFPGREAVMSWEFWLLAILGGLIVLMSVGIPVAFAFIMINLIGVYFLWGGVTGWEQLIFSMADSVTSFSLMPVPLFILMGTLLFNSGITSLYIDRLNRLLGRVPARLSLLAIVAGVMFATLTAVSMASVAVLGATLVPEMKKRDYKKSMILGPILASGGLAHMIPPSDLGVILGGIGQISVGGILMGIIFPGLLLAFLYAAYVIIRAKLQPELAPPYSESRVTLVGKMKDAAYLLPAGIVIFCVIGFIYLGITTPTEAAASGAAATLILIACYGRLSWKVVIESFAGTVRITTLVFMLIVGAKAFSQLLAFTGAAKGILDFALSVPLPPICVIMMQQLVILFMGCFMEVVSIMMVTVPLFLPIVNALGYDSVWFAVLFLINTETALITPPFGMSLFVMKNVSPEGTSMADIYRSVVPFLILQLVAICMVMAFPQIALFLPSTMR
jgi:tripartite ATP-independent transporter DctM subunit